MTGQSSLFTTTEIKSVIFPQKRSKSIVH